MSGKLYGVGVGPGDPELITLKALRIMKECDYIAIPNDKKERCLAYTIAEGAFPEINEKPVILVNMPMTKSETELTHAHRIACDNLAAYLNQGHTIAFLTLGDPTVYSTYLYLHQLLVQDHYDCEIINGIPSFCAAAAAINEGLVERDQPLHLIPASYALDSLIDLPGTKVLMKSGRQLSSVRNALINKNMISKMVANCGMDNQEVYSCIEEFPEQSSYYSLIIAKDL
ncbi:MAG: precorrin-2 C(20)-methyltransferase [Lachnospiraceae bacterium]|nr:precorrin-2 C(20)-methyltransferase [Lachnospiraceae bacterium]